METIYWIIAGIVWYGLGMWGYVMAVIDDNQDLTIKEVPMWLIGSVLGLINVLIWVVHYRTWDKVLIRKRDKNGKV
jgi:hypothetical protein